MLANQHQRSILNEQQVLTRRNPGDELPVLYTIVQRDLRYTKMAATAAVSFAVF